MKNSILIVDDDKELGDILEEILAYDGYKVTYAGNGNDAITIVEESNIDIVLLDLRLPDMSGNDVLKNVLKIKPATTVIMMSGHGTIKTAIDATRLGAYDWLEKPLEMDRVLLTVNNAIMKNTLLKEKAALLSATKERYRMVGTSPALKKIYSLIDKVAPTKATILVTGPSGAGKELIAQALHINSKRAIMPFIHINCSAVPETLIETELFGHVKGAFTGALKDKKGKFQLADGGTLFMDEIGDLSLAAQAKVLLAIDSGKIAKIGTEKPEDVDVRIIAATNKNLYQMVADGTFRDDLLHRINVIEIGIPPLSERPTDILPLANHFFEQFCNQNNSKKRNLTPDAEACLISYKWPGNVRELRNFIEKLVILVDDQEITGPIISNLLRLPHLEIDLTKAKTFQHAKESFEKSYIIYSLEANDWNISKTARNLNMNRAALYLKIDKYELERSQKSKIPK